MKAQRVDIKNSKGILIGYINYDKDSATAYHLRKGYAGRYSEKSDLTFDSKGVLFCHGDGLQTLVRNMETN